MNKPKTNIRVRGFAEVNRRLKQELAEQPNKKIDVNRIGSYLSGNFPPYYQTQSKIVFILTLIAEASNVFDSTERFDFIARHTHSLQSFFTESLSLIEDEDTLVRIADKLKVPSDARYSNLYL